MALRLVGGMVLAVGGSLEAGRTRWEGVGRGRIVRLSPDQRRVIEVLRRVQPAASGLGLGMMEEWEESSLILPQLVPWEPQ